MKDQKFVPFTISLVEDIEAGVIVTGGGVNIRDKRTGERSFVHDEYVINPYNLNRLLAFYEVLVDDIKYVK